MEADLHAITNSICLSQRPPLNWVTECSPPRSDPSSHSPTFISGLLFIRPFAVSSTSTPPTSSIMASSRVTPWSMPTGSSKSATLASYNNILLGEVPMLREVPTRVPLLNMLLLGGIKHQRSCHVANHVSLPQLINNISMPIFNWNIWSTAIDIWSVGRILAELLLRKPIFQL